MFRPLVLVATLAAALPAAAQVVTIPYAPIDETAAYSGAWARYQTHILKLGADRYAVLFRPGFIDRTGAVRAVAPLCAAQGKTAAGLGTIAPVQLIFEQGAASVQQGYQVVCN